MLNAWFGTERFTSSYVDAVIQRPKVWRLCRATATSKVMKLAGKPNRLPVFAVERARLDKQDFARGSTARIREKEGGCETGAHANARVYCRRSVVEVVNVKGGRWKRAKGMPRIFLRLVDEARTVEFHGSHVHCSFMISKVKVKTSFHVRYNAEPGFDEDASNTWSTC